jgi:hypothetical protein
MGVMAATSREHTRTYFLGKLARELETRGLEAVLRTDPPTLRITDPDTAMVSETVDCVALADGWFYRFSWGDVVESTDNPAAAADRIRHVLVTSSPNRDA